MNGELKSMDACQKKLLRHKLSSICGWLELGNATAAREEAASLTPEELRQSDTIEMLYELSRHEKDWSGCLYFGKALSEVAPDDAGSWVRYCNALFWCEEVERARDLAIEKISEFPKVWDLVYNLACYLTRLHHFDRALQALRKAAQLSNDLNYFQHQAQIDPDLEPLWRHLGKKAEDFFASGDMD